MEKLGGAGFCYGQTVKQVVNVGDLKVQNSEEARALANVGHEPRGVLQEDKADGSCF